MPCPSKDELKSAVEKVAADQPGNRCTKRAAGARPPNARRSPPAAATMTSSPPRQVLRRRLLRRSERQGQGDVLRVHPHGRRQPGQRHGLLRDDADGLLDVRAVLQEGHRRLPQERPGVQREARQRLGRVGRRRGRRPRPPEARPRRGALDARPRGNVPRSIASTSLPCTECASTSADSAASNNVSSSEMSRPESTPLRWSGGPKAAAS